MSENTWSPLDVLGPACVKLVGGSPCGARARVRIGLELCDKHYYDLVASVMQSQVRNYPDDTRWPGYVYFASDLEGNIKIGSSATSENLSRRMGGLAQTHGVTYMPVRVYPGGVVLEHVLHSRFREQWRKGELYAATGPVAEYMEANPGIPFTLTPKTPGPRAESRTVWFEIVLEGVS
jgi:hypothetical protein